MTTLACVYKTGGDFTLEYVERLTNSLKPYGRTVCLSDDPEVARFCEHVPLTDDLPGWWSKVELFKLNGHVIYFDLDTVINGDLTEIIEAQYDFAMLEDFFWKGIPASGVMAWRGDYSHIYRNFDRKMIEQFKASKSFGDQGYFATQVKEIQFFQKILPERYVVSRKVHTNREKSAIVCYHGQPRPHQVDWAI